MHRINMHWFLFYDISLNDYKIANCISLLSGSDDICIFSLAISTRKKIYVFTEFINYKEDNCHIADAYVKIKQTKHVLFCLLRFIGHENVVKSNFLSRQIENMIESFLIYYSSTYLI